MPDESVFPLSSELLWILTAVAVLGLFWQWRVVRRNAPGGATLPGPGFWVVAGWWVLVGLLAQGKWRGSGAGTVLAWGLPVAGLLVLAALRWVGAELPRLLREESDQPRAGASAHDAGSRALDAEDVRLLQRLVSLRARPATQLMLPLARAAAIREGGSVEDVLALLRAGRALRIPVLDAGGMHVRGVIDGRDLIPAAFPAAFGPAEEPQRMEGLDRLWLRVPAVPSSRTAAELLESLRTTDAGVAVIVDPRDTALGLVSWDHLYQALLGRPADEVRL